MHARHVRRTRTVAPQVTPTVVAVDFIAYGKVVLTLTPSLTLTLPITLTPYPLPLPLPLLLLLLLLLEYYYIWKGCDPRAAHVPAVHMCRRGAGLRQRRAGRVSN